MAKFYGIIGFALLAETETGIWEEQITKRPYKGTITRRRHNWDSTPNLNNDLDISMDLTIVSDNFAFEHWPAIRYITWNNVQYAVKAIIVERPHITLSIGGVYNAKPTESTGGS